MRFLLSSAAALCLAAAAPHASAGSADRLYADLGETAGLTRIVDTLFEDLLTDPRTAATFEHSDVARVKAQLVVQLCEVSGGPCTYEGLSMADAHMGHGLTRAHMNAMIELMRDAMDEEGVSFRAQNRLLARLAPMERDVTER